MADTIYNVVLNLSTTGSLATSLGSVGSKAASADDQIKKLGESGKRMAETIGGAAERVGSFLEGAADKAFALAGGFAKVAAVGIIAGATYGVMGLNNELEQTQLSLGAIAQAQGFTKTFEGGFRLAGEQLTKMKQDVKTLPGDLGQLSNIMKMIATPAAKGGASMDDIRKLAGRTMLTAGILGVQQDVAAREMAGLIAGRAGSHNILGGRLGLIGDDAKKFNEMGPEARLAKLNEELNKYSGAADKFGQSFIANWTTLKDNVKYALLGPATSPLFEHVKSTIIDINTYFDTHKAQVEQLTHIVGDRLANGWDAIVKDAKALEPIVARVVSYLENMSPGDAVEKIRHAGEILLATKVAGMGLSAAGKVLPGAMSMGSRIGASLFGGEAAAAEGGEGLAAAGFGMAGGLTVGAAALAAVGTAAVLAGGEMSALADTSSAYHHDAVIAATDLAKAIEHLEQAVRPATSAIGNFAEKIGTTFTEGFATAIEATTSFFQGWHALVKHHVHTEADEIQNPRQDALPDTDKNQQAMYGLLRLGEGGGFQFSEEQKRAVKASASAGIHVHGPIQINVEGAGDPSRVARLVLSQFQALARNPTRSPSVPDYSASR